MKKAIKILAENEVYLMYKLKMLYPRCKIEKFSKTTNNRYKVTLTQDNNNENSKAVVTRINDKTQ